MIVQTEEHTMAVTSHQRSTRRPTLVVLEQGDLSASCLPSGLTTAVLSATNWQEAEQISQETPCCVLVDFDFDPAGVARQLRDRRNDWIQLSCVACSGDTSVQNIVRAIRAGYVDFLPKPIQADSLSHACTYACHIDSDGEHSPSQVRARFATLTDREVEVLKLFLDGRNTKMIAKNLGVSYQTIDKHRNRALKKLQINSLIDLARIVNGESLNMESGTV